MGAAGDDVKDCGRAVTRVSPSKSSLSGFDGRSLGHADECSTREPGLGSLRIEFQLLLPNYSVTQVHQLPHAISLGEKDKVLLDFSTQT